MQFLWSRFLMELLVVGIVVTIVGLPISYFGMILSKSDKLPSVSAWISISLSLFIIGVVVHVLFEISGMNREYVRYYCLNK